MYGERAGRTYEFKGFEYPIPAGMKLVECTRCHEMPMTPAEIEAVEGPIAELHRERMARSLDQSLRVLEKKVSIGQIEKALHVSQGYLARARTKGEPSFQLVALLRLLAEEPKRGLAMLDDLAQPGR